MIIKMECSFNAENVNKDKIKSVVYMSKKLNYFIRKSRYLGIKFCSLKVKQFNKEGKHKIYYSFAPCRNTNIRF